jgi:hypothetical protein
MRGSIKRKIMEEKKRMLCKGAKLKKNSIGV